MKQAGFVPILIVILLAAALLGGYFIYQKQIIQFSPSNITVQEAVENFYTKYFDCLNRHFQNSGGKSPRENCPWDDPALNDELVEKLNLTRASDPILCAQNLANNIKVDKAQVNGDTATTTVHTYFSASGDNQILIGLIRKAGQWKINEITCANY